MIRGILGFGRKRSPAFNREHADKVVAQYREQLAGETY